LSTDFDKCRPWQVTELVNDIEIRTDVWYTAYNDLLYERRPCTNMTICRLHVHCII
jgi:hypothetical protein